MKPKRIMLIAGETSGDILAAELVRALREQLTTLEATPTTDYQPRHASLEPRFFGAGGHCVAAAGVELAFDMTVHSVTGFSDVLKSYFTFRRLFNQLYQLAVEREPDAIICVDFFGFNGRFAHAIRNYTRSRDGWFHDWQPKIIQYVSPQVWASRESRARQMARDHDLLLTIVPFEKQWYAKRVPRLAVEFVGHPIVDRYADVRSPKSEAQSPKSKPADLSSILHPLSSPLLLLLPGSRTSELTRHVPVMLGALKIMRAQIPSLRAQMVLPNETLLQQTKVLGVPADLQIQSGGLSQALSAADVALASTGTVTLESAYFGVPAVAMYKTSWLSYEIARRIAKVKYVAMPNLLAGQEIFPEFIQHAATPDNIAKAALELLRDESRRINIKSKLSEIIRSLGPPGATQRAARSIVRLLLGPAREKPEAELAAAEY